MNNLENNIDDLQAALKIVEKKNLFLFGNYKNMQDFLITEGIPQQQIQDLNKSLRTAQRKRRISWLQEKLV